jgi:hypothetical protein
MAIKWKDKDPDDQLDYSVDWQTILEGLTISSIVWKIEDANGTLQTWTQGQIVNGLQYVSSTNTDTVATLYLGSGTAFTTYYITCRMTTSTNTVFEQEIRLRVVEKN